MKILLIVLYVLIITSVLVESLIHFGLLGLPIYLAMSVFVAIPIRRASAWLDNGKA